MDACRDVEKSVNAPASDPPLVEAREFVRVNVQTVFLPDEVRLIAPSPWRVYNAWFTTAALVAFASLWVFFLRDPLVIALVVATVVSAVGLFFTL
jgi:hypothetical protein